MNGPRFMLVLLSFYLSGSRLTKVGAKRKKAIDEGYKEGGQRGAEQVLACSAIATVISLTYMYSLGFNDHCLDFAVHPLGTLLISMYLGHYSICAADTWSSEIGVLSTSRPILISNPFITCPPGTNGGITLLGTSAGIAGGTFIGIVAYFTSLFSVSEPCEKEGNVILFCAIMGLLGTVLGL